MDYCKTEVPEETMSGITAFTYGNIVARFVYMLTVCQMLMRMRSDRDGDVPLRGMLLENKEAIIQARAGGDVPGAVTEDGWGYYDASLARGPFLEKRPVRVVFLSDGGRSFLEISGSGPGISVDELANDLLFLLKEGLRQNTLSWREFAPALAASRLAKLYPASLAQRGMFLMQKLYKNETAFNVPVMLYLTGRIQISRLREAFQRVIARHESLRTSFLLTDGILYQRIQPLFTFDLRHSVVREEDLPRNLSGFVRPFDLEKAPLIRCELLQYEESAFCLLLDMHHIIGDEVSMSIIREEIEQIYGGGEPEPVLVQYREFSAGQDAWLASGECKLQECYWLSKFAAGVPSFELPTERRRPAVKSFEGDTIRLRVEGDDLDKLGSLAGQCTVSINNILFSVYNLLLAKYSGKNMVVTGYVVRGRIRRELERSVGMFVNMLPMVCDVQGSALFSAFAGQVKQQMTEAFLHQEYPVENLMNKVKRKGPAADAFLFHIVYSYYRVEESRWNSQDLFTGVHKSRLEHRRRAKFDLSMEVVHRNEHIDINLYYDVALFGAGSIRHFAESMLTVIRQAQADTGMRLANLGLREASQKITSSFGEFENDYEF